MAFVPYERFTIDTALPLDEARDRVARLVEPYQFFRNPFSREHAEFQGEVTPQGFRISRIIHYRNSFIPIIKGQFVRLPSGTQLIVRMSLHPAVIAFMIFWLGGVGWALLPSLSGPQWAGGILTLFGISVFVYLLATGGFKWESSKARKRFMQLFAGERSA